LRLFIKGHLRCVPNRILLFFIHQGEEGEEADLEVPRVYDPVIDLQQLSDRLEMFQQQYNETVRGAKMDLVFFKVYISTDSDL